LIVDDAFSKLEVTDSLFQFQDKVTRGKESMRPMKINENPSK